MAESLSYPDSEWAISDLLASLVGGVGHTGLEAPSNLQDLLPYIVVSRSGGASIDFEDHPTIEIDIYGPTRAIVKALADQVLWALTTGPNVVSGTLSDGTTPYVAVIDHVSCIVGPRKLPTGDDNIRRFGLTVEADFRARRVT